MKNIVLIADDDPGIIEVTSLILENANYTVVTASNVEETIEKIEQHCPDIVLLDIWLAGKNGAIVAKKLKTNKETQNIPVIMISANNQIASISEQAGADGYIAKPFDIDYLEQVVQKHLDNSIKC